MEFLNLFLTFIFIFLLFFYAFRNNKSSVPTNWPFVGMLLALLKNLHRIHDFCIELTEGPNLSFLLKGPWYTSMELLITSDPRDIHHILSKNFSNYPKGAKFNEIFDVLGDGIFNADGELWKYHRRMAQTFVGQPQFHQLLIEKIYVRVENGLIPVLNHASKQGLVLDLQDLFERFTFDNICSLTMGYELGSLCVDLPSIPFSKALDDIEEVIFYRHVIPVSVWKFIRWLGVGKERKYKKAWETLDKFIYNCIANKHETMKQLESINPNDDEQNIGVDLLTLYKDKDDKFLRDTVLNFFIAGRDTTSTSLSWFFYLLSKNPQVHSKIREELISTMNANEDNNCNMNKWYDFTRNNFKETSDKLVYLHGALCEALRLYPPVVFQGKIPVEPDILPSGHKVEPHMQIIFNLYAMGRTKSIWGEDCCEFKPERWISPQGKIRHEPSYKFLAFNAGPRTCVGKDMAFIQMKVVAATIILNYEFQPLEGQSIVPENSIILRMKNGFKVKMSKISLLSYG
ncbi:alkane hydroxylase MAH1-like [Silene latifolia]|uniref:alkane hydroxylase MAH1-like n=1 Tax=Silene latifolia TaxID=37657 RepID=UPI003D77F98C